MEHYRQLQNIEKDILRSMIDYPDYIAQFLLIVPLECFSKEGKIFLDIIRSLQDTGSLNIDIFLSKLSKQVLESDYCVDFLARESMVNYINLAKEFLYIYKIHQQEIIGEKLIQASNNKTLLDIDSLHKNIGVNEYKNLSDWIEYQKNKKPIEKYKTGVYFLDSVFDGGIEAAQLVLISGDPEAGKTTLGLQILENMSFNIKVGFFSFEFTIDQYIKDKKKKPNDVHFENMFIINDGYDIYQIAQNIRNLYRLGVRVFLIDSQMRIVSPQGRNMEEEESLKFSLLARLCHSLGIVVILIVQTAKSDRDNPMGSKKGGHESSITIRIEHCSAKNEELREFDENSRLIILKKNKQTGKHYKEKVRFSPSARRFYPIEKLATKNAEIIPEKDILQVVQL